MNSQPPQEPRLADLEESPDFFEFSPLPSSSHGQAAFHISSSILPVVNDRRALLGLLGFLLKKSGRSAGEVGQSMGINATTVHQYLRGRRPNFSLGWFLRYVQACGGKVRIEF